MKKMIFILQIVLLVTYSCGNSKDYDSTKPTPWPQDDKSGIDRTYGVGQHLENNQIKLVWADEFGDNDLSQEFWSYEKGYVRNKEVQYYTVNRKDNCKLENGMLVITGQKEVSEYEGAKYTSASIITNKKKSWQYGRFEIRAKVPAGKTGIWPAFWAKGDSQNTGVRWPGCGEIDIMEYAARNPYDMLNNVIWGDASNAVKSNSKAVKSTTKYSDDFHIYSLNWNSTQITFAIDNTVTHVVEMSDISPNPFHQPCSLLINLALGTPTSGSLGGKFDESTLPVQFFVDYVRVYQTSNEK